MIKIHNLSKNYGKFSAVDDLNMEIGEGELFGFIGPNGAGKTTTMRILAGLLRADGGEVLIGGADIFKEKRLKEMIGYMPDFFGVYDNLTVMEYLEFYGSAYGIEEKKVREISHELLELVNLENKKEAFVDELSRGMKQKLCLARTLIHDPKILILDEPASGLDPGTRFEMKEILKQLSTNGKTIILSSHILMDLAEICTSIGIIQQGKMVVQGRIDTILDSADISNPLIINVIDSLEEAIPILKKNAFVRSVSIQGNSAVCAFKGGRREEAQLLRELVEQKITVSSFAREQSSLERLFVKITDAKEE